MEKRLVRLPEVERITGLKKSAIYKKIKEGEEEDKFPSAVKLGTKHVAWISEEIYSWIDRRQRVERKKKK